MKRIYLSGPMSGLPELNPEPNTGWHECMRNDLKALLDRVGMEIVIAKEVLCSCATSTTKEKQND